MQYICVAESEYETLYRPRKWVKVAAKHKKDDVEIYSFSQDSDDINNDNHGKDYQGNIGRCET